MMTYLILSCVKDLFSILPPSKIIFISDYYFLFKYELKEIIHTKTFLRDLSIYLQ